MHPSIIQLSERFAEAASPVRARQQAAYMRDQFVFWGIPMPQVRSIVRSWRQDAGISGAPDELVRALFDLPEREYQYAAMMLLRQQARRLPLSALPLLEWTMDTKAWWDSVDDLSHTVGELFRRFPDEARPRTARWISSGHLWHCRCAIIFQLGYRSQTNQPLLWDNIRACIAIPALAREFFIQKAIGWALRDYARTAPAAVLSFVNQTSLPALSRREALKHLGSQA